MACNNLAPIKPPVRLPLSQLSGQIPSSTATTLAASERPLSAAGSRPATGTAGRRSNSRVGNAKVLIHIANSSEPQEVSQQTAPPKPREYKGAVAKLRAHIIAAAPTEEQVHFTKKEEAFAACLATYIRGTDFFKDVFSDQTEELIEEKYETLIYETWNMVDGCPTGRLCNTTKFHRYSFCTEYMAHATKDSILNSLQKCNQTHFKYEAEFGPLESALAVQPSKKQNKEMRHLGGKFFSRLVAPENETVVKANKDLKLVNAFYQARGDITTALNHLEAQEVSDM